MLVKIMDRQDERRLDALEILLVYGYGFTHLPEVYEVFGRETLVKFLDVFGGVEFKVPTQADLRDCARNVSIYMELEKGSNNGQDVVNSLAKQHGLTRQAIHKIHREVKDIVTGFFKVGVRRGTNGRGRKTGRKSGDRRVASD